MTSILHIRMPWPTQCPWNISGQSIIKEKKLSNTSYTTWRERGRKKCCCPFIVNPKLEIGNWMALCCILQPLHDNSGGGVNWNMRWNTNYLSMWRFMLFINIQRDYPLETLSYNCMKNDNNCEQRENTNWHRRWNWLWTVSMEKWDNVSFQKLFGVARMGCHNTSLGMTCVRLKKLTNNENFIDSNLKQPLTCCFWGPLWDLRRILPPWDEKNSLQCSTKLALKTCSIVTPIVWCQWCLWPHSSSARLSWENGNWNTPLVTWQFGVQSFIDIPFKAQMWQRHTSKESEQRITRMNSGKKSSKKARPKSWTKMCSKKNLGKSGWTVRRNLSTSSVPIVTFSTGNVDFGRDQYRFRTSRTLKITTCYMRMRCWVTWVLKKLTKNLTQKLT